MSKMIDFTTLKSLTIPEGNVAEIKDASGNVLWSAAKPVTISYTLGSASYTTYSHIIHNGIEYTGEGSLIANIGDIILVRCSRGGRNNAAVIYLNGELNEVASASGDNPYAEYNYKVVSDATIKKDTGSATMFRGAIFITDANA